jgi:hypothetical protein
MLLSDSIPALSEEHMMSQQSKRELFAEVQPRYLKANKAEMQKILDEFTATTGYPRKYAIRILKHGYKRRPNKPKGRTAIYRGEVVEALEQIWEIYGRICSKRLPLTYPKGSKYWNGVASCHFQRRPRICSCASAVPVLIAVWHLRASTNRTA